MESFAFHRPTSLDEAARLLGSSDEPKLLAGGQSLLPVLKMELGHAGTLISLAALTELKGIRDAGAGVTVGAGVTHTEVSRSELVHKAIPALASLAERIGDAQVRNRGTLGGSIAHADPAADYPAAVVALDASVKTQKRTLGADGFFKGMFETALEPGEIIVEVTFRKPERAGYAKFASPASKYALVGVFVAKHGGEVRVAVTGAATSVFRVPAMEKALAARFDPAALDGIKPPEGDLMSAPDASAGYRAHLIGVMARRAVAEALKG